MECSCLLHRIDAPTADLDESTMYFYFASSVCFFFEKKQYYLGNCGSAGCAYVALLRTQTYP